jgi:microsomal dipeptidase-like Zn-dependent dipeptidase
MRFPQKMSAQRSRKEKSHQCSEQRGIPPTCDVTKYARLHQVGASIPTIRLMYDLGVRYITLTHTCDNPFATSCTTVAQGGEDHGLTAIGHEAVREMNRLGNSNQGTND